MFGLLLVIHNVSYRVLIDHALVSAMIDAGMENQKKSLTNSLELMEMVAVFLVSPEQEIEIHFRYSLLNR